MDGGGGGGTPMRLEHVGARLRRSGEGDTGPVVHLL